MATIIKAETTAPQKSGIDVQPVAFNFGDIAQQADQYLEQVRGQAVQIVHDAQRQAETIRQQAAEEGRQAALNAVQSVLDEKVAKHIHTLVPALNQAIVEIQNAKQDWINQWQQSAVKLATAIAARVIRRQLDQSPEITLDLVQEALQLAAGSAEITLRLHPDDYKVLGEQTSKLAEQLCQLAPSDVVADAEIERGGCRVDTRFGSIDQQFQAQLARIEEELN